jgi:hypothetical protein
MSLPEDLHDLIIDICFYSSVDKGKKLCFTTRTTVDGCGIYSFCKRRWYSENCDRLVEETKNLVKRIEDGTTRPEWKIHRYLLYYYIPQFIRAIGNQIAIYVGYTDVLNNLCLSKIGLNGMLSRMTDEEKRGAELHKQSIQYGGTPTGILQHINEGIVNPQGVVIDGLGTPKGISPGYDTNCNPDNCTCVDNGIPISGVGSGFYTKSTPIDIPSTEKNKYHP